MFGSERLAALEARVAALEPKVSTESPEDPIKALTARVEKLEKEVLPAFDSIWYFRSFNRLFGSVNDESPKALTLRQRVERICEHLKIEFKNEPSRVVIKSTAKKSKA